MTDIHKIFQEIEKKSKDGDYIYRGEPKCHENVSSRLWRKFAKNTQNYDVPRVDISKVEDELFCGVQKHVPTPDEKKIDLLSEIQHFGGDTNLIDFTTNYLIALFFACEKLFDENGRVILQDKDEERDMIVEPDIPQNPRDSQHRIVVQKSVFFRGPDGFFNPEERNIVTILAHQKKDIMSYLQKYHDISMSTVYGDLHGYIKYQDRHGGGYTQFYAGLASMNQGNCEMAVGHFTRAIDLDYATIKDAYFFRGRAYAELAQYDKSIYDKSINDYDAASEFMRDDPKLYLYRGLSYLAKKVFDMALEDFNRAINLDNQQDRAFLARGWIYDKVNNNSEQALSDYDESIRLDPEGSSAYQFRGALHYEMYEDTKIAEYWPKALEDFKRAANIDPSVKEDIPVELKRAMDFSQTLRDSVAGRDITGRRISTS